MEIKRDYYLNKLISKKNNKLIKIVTGIRRCGKSYLLDPIFKNYLLANGVDENHIIKLELDSIENEEYTNPKKLYEYVMERANDNNTYYVILDEIQKVNDFESVLNSFLINDNDFEEIVRWFNSVNEDNKEELSNKINNLLDNKWDKGFLYKETVYKVKKNDKDN